MLVSLDLQQAINLNYKYQEMAPIYSDFDNIRNDTRFQRLISSQ
ncbi:TPR end-of-group domain-containing protein [Dulcicalothrix desertica]|nr:hypothetical protein [Dulcicalothrix desertica]